MKLLFDQNISFRIVARLKDEFPHSMQVRRLDLENRQDRFIWDYAKQNGYTIVTFDTDFYDLASLFGHPPKIIWIRLINPSTDELAHELKVRREVIQAFIESREWNDVSCLEIG
jgi:predicted nuclease of predicted toxin-antitoxin system